MLCTNQLPAVGDHILHPIHDRRIKNGIFMLRNQNFKYNMALTFLLFSVRNWYIHKKAIVQTEHAF